MASISTEKSGRRVVQFIGRDSKRRSIRLGKVSERYAHAIALKVEELNIAAISGTAVSVATEKWLIDCDKRLSDRLAAVGLVSRREAVELGPFIDGYINQRSANVKPRTLSVYRQTQRNLIACFGSGKRLNDLTPGDGDDFAAYLQRDGLGPATVRRRCGIAKQYLRAAERKRVIAQNPFYDLKSAVSPNRERDYFVTREESRKVLEACPDAEWRLLVGLSRYGGLRCPSEHLRLRWVDVNWNTDRMTVHSPKTEHHEGGESREIPIYADLLPLLRDVFESAGTGEYVITRYRHDNANLRTRLLRIIKKAGLNPWPKLFQNMRSTRQTELEDVYPTHVVCAWMGNSPRVARKHYLQVTDEHMAHGASFEKAVQIPVQQASETGGNGRHRENAQCDESLQLPTFAASCRNLQSRGMRPAGLEPATC